MRSDQVKKGISRAPHRALFKAMGYTDEELAGPIIGVANSFNEIIPGHIHLRTIAEAVEIMAQAHMFDGLVLIPNCDKIIPGMLMAAGRLNIPTIVVSGGPMLAGELNGQKLDLNTVFEGVGAHAAGKITEEELKNIEDRACPGCGSCAGMFTANTMNCLTEVLGMGLPGN